MLGSHIISLAVGGVVIFGGFVTSTIDLLNNGKPAAQLRTNKWKMRVVKESIWAIFTITVY